jgi:hypothetical protein
LRQDRAQRKGAMAMHVLVEGFDIFGVRIQHWMFIAVATVAVAILVKVQSRQ